MASSLDGARAGPFANTLFGAKIWKTSSSAVRINVAKFRRRNDVAPELNVIDQLTVY